MRIAQIAPLFEAVPPKLYGGTERVVSNLTEALVAMGHDVTLFASGDSQTSARLDAPWPQALRLDPDIRDWPATYHILIEHVRRRAADFDVLHFHIDYWPNAVFTRQDTPFVTTMHGRLDLPEFAAVYRMFPSVPMVSISNNQRKPLPDLNWAATVYHGLPDTLLTPVATAPEPEPYLAFLGRISPEKGIERAVRIANACKMKLKVAAKVDNADRKYYDSDVAPLLSQGNIEFIGEINDAQKPAFLSAATALLVPINWEEPFGLVMIEAMACGCPVIAFRRGSVPEVMQDGVSGYVVDTVEQAIEAVARLPQIGRAGVRAYFDRRFTARRMAEDYVSVYERLIADKDR